MKKQEEENSDQLLRRFMRTLQEENKITDMKEKVYFSKGKNKRARKDKTLRRLKIVQRRQKELRGY